MWQADELSINARGGTELVKWGLWDRLTQNEREAVQVICSRVRYVDPDKPSILWLHDLWNDPENSHLIDPLLRKRFAKFVFVSYWQWTTYHQAYGIPWSQAVVIPNAIVPMNTRMVYCRDNMVRLIYHTTPHRGLEILVPVFDRLYQQDKQIHLDVFSSFSAYGWPQRDEPYKNLFDFCRDHPGITYHGYQPNEIVRRALMQSHVFAYPSIWPETFCIAAAEAMSACNYVVCPMYGALPDTLKSYGVCYQWTEDVNEHANRFLTMLQSTIALVRNNGLNDHLLYQKAYADRVYSWNNILPAWKSLIDEVRY